jgi:hypothetical protein
LKFFSINRPTAQKEAKEAGNTKVIRFIYKEGSESEMYDPLQGYNVEELRLDHGDPALFKSKSKNIYPTVGGLVTDIRSSYIYRSVIAWQRKRRTKISGS